MRHGLIQFLITFRVNYSDCEFPGGNKQTWKYTKFLYQKMLLSIKKQREIPGGQKDCENGKDSFFNQDQFNFYLMKGE
jgi:hypothetical protein